MQSPASCQNDFHTIPEVKAPVVSCCLNQGHVTCSKLWVYLVYDLFQMDPLGGAQPEDFPM